ncbi:MAG TPA: O-antigen ligase family protein [Pirellulales bacterium]|nr:O-antigen ligase family protein [Pirellulales bacterium]
MSSAIATRAVLSDRTHGLAGNQVGLGLLAACIMINDANFRVANPNEVSLDWQTAMRLALCALCGGYGLLNLPQALNTLTRFPTAWLVLFAGWALFTIPFAIVPTYAAAACGALISTTLFTAALVARVRGEAIVKAILASILLLVVGCWIAQFVRPELGQPDHMTPGHEPVGWRLGGLMHPNGLGAHCALAIAMLLVGRQTWNWSWTSVLALTAVLGITLLATGSRTSSLMVVATGALLAVRRNAGYLALAAGLMAGVLFLGEAFGSDWTRFLTLFTRENGLQEISTFTGRTDLWSTAVDFIGRSPVWGHGYGCSRYIFLEAADFPATHPHNLFLDTAIETGIVGALIEGAMFVALARRMVIRPCALPDMVLVMVAVMGLVEVPVFNPLPEAFTLTWMLTLGWRREEGSRSTATLGSPASSAILPAGLHRGVV